VSVETKMARKRKRKRIASYARLRRNRILLITNIIYLFQKVILIWGNQSSIAHWVNAGEAIHTLRIAYTKL